MSILDRAGLLSQASMPTFPGADMSDVPHAKCDAGSWVAWIWDWRWLDTVSMQKLWSFVASGCVMKA